jgi:carboxypeptidase A2
MQSFWLLLAFVLVTLGARTTFHDHKVVRIPVQSLDDLDYFTELFLSKNTFDFCIENFEFVHSVDIRVTPEQWTWFSYELKKRSIVSFVIIDNVQELYEQQLAGTVGVKPTRLGEIDYASYHTYDEIIDWLNELPLAYPDLVTLVPIGESYQGREILAVKITSQDTSNKPKVWFDGGLHAREWISTATVVYILGHLLEDYGTDTIVTALVDGLEIYVLPVFNPDGYVYSWTTNRMWRKTRQPNTGSSCIGTDPNRNWEFQWGGAGVSRDPCNDAYLGNSPFSQIEVLQVAHYIRDNDFSGYINFHAYSQLWMGPWGYSAILPPDINLQNSVASKCANAIYDVHGVTYRYGPIATTIYLASGSSVDYTYAVGHVLYSFAVELRDTGAYGFLLPANQIVPSGEETFNAVIVWALEVLTNAK